MPIHRRTTAHAPRRAKRSLPTDLESKAIRDGVTLIEILVVVAIIAALLAMLIPAVQSAREASRRAVCKNNIHQIALALVSYEGRHHNLPSLYNGSFLNRPRQSADEFFYHSWRSQILAELEESSILASLDLSVPATDPKNQPAINHEIAIFVCPSTSNTHKIVPDIQTIGGPSSFRGTAARSDYEAVGGVQVAPLPPSSADPASSRSGTGANLAVTKIPAKGFTIAKRTWPTFPMVCRTRYWLASGEAGRTFLTAASRRFLIRMPAKTTLPIRIKPPGASASFIGGCCFGTNRQ